METELVCCVTCKDLNFIYLECLHSICSHCLKKHIINTFPDTDCPICKNCISQEYINIIFTKDDIAEIENSQLLKTLIIEDNQGCQLCHQIKVIILKCEHVICIPCFIHLSKLDINIKCNHCKKLISEEEKEFILGSKLYNQLIGKSLSESLKGLIKCIKCNVSVIVEEGNDDIVLRDNNYNEYPKKYTEDYLINRFRCYDCNTEFCLKCKKSPFHTGRFCNEKLTGKICRFDNRAITDLNKGPLNDICNNDECIQTFDSYCKSKLKCGHKCYGLKKMKCLPCLDRNCIDYNNKYEYHSESICSICLEDFSKFPIIISDCNHIMHYKCINLRLKKRWLTPKITFNHLKCPDCNEWLNFKDLYIIQDIISQHSLLYKKVCKLSLSRLNQGPKDARLIDPNSEWFNKEIEFALYYINYYLCYMCNEPYYGGNRNCDENDNDQMFEYNPKNLKCNKHIQSIIDNNNTCIHGDEYYIYKCRFCCSIAMFICFGDMRTCYSCHSKIMFLRHETITNRCKGGSSCPLKVKKHGIGEYCFGCSLCNFEKLLK